MKTGLHLYSPAFSDFVGSLAGAGREAVVQRVTKGAHGIHPGPARETGGGRGLVSFEAALPALPPVGVAVSSAAARARVRVQAAGAALIQLV